MCPVKRDNVPIHDTYYIIDFRVFKEMAGKRLNFMTKKSAFTRKG